MCVCGADVKRFALPPNLQAGEYKVHLVEIARRSRQPTPNVYAASLSRSVTTSTRPGCIGTGCALSPPRCARLSSPKVTRAEAPSGRTSSSRTAIIPIGHGGSNVMPVSTPSVPQPQCTNNERQLMSVWSGGVPRGLSIAKRRVTTGAPSSCSGSSNASPRSNVSESASSTLRAPHYD